MTLVAWCSSSLRRVYSIKSKAGKLLRRTRKRTLAWSAPAPFAAGKTLAEALLEPTRIYIKSVLPVLRSGLVSACAHITGGGLTENPPRVIAEHLVARFDWAAWEPPAVFDWLQRTGGVADAEMRRTFNCGVGLILTVSPQNAEPVLAALLNAGESAFVCGELAPA